MSEIHILKTWPESYQSIKKGFKTFEVRKNDRDFKLNDVLILQEYDPNMELYTGEMDAFIVTYFLQGEFGLPKNMCVMSIIPEESLTEMIKAD